MRWKFQDRWDKILRLKGIAWGDRNVATSRISEAMSTVGADIVDVHFFSGVQTTLAFGARPASVRALAKALTEAGLELDEESLTVLEAGASASEELEGTLSITFPDGESDLRREVPSVPG
ncbi:MAG: hypothetical protein U0183_08620 [Polyangiaceae bacterium]